MVTIVEIAEATGVPIKTAARILSGETKRSKHRDKVLACAEKMGYVRDEHAATMRTGKSPLIGLVVPSIDNPFYTSSIQTFHDRLRESDFAMMLACSFGDHDTISEVLERLRAYKVSGVIFNGSEGDFSEEHQVLLARMQEEGRPVVLIGRERGELPVDQVNIDNRSAVNAAVDHLAERGFKHPAFIGGDPDNATIRQRLKGFKAGVKEHGFTYRDEWISMGPTGAAEVKERVNWLVSRERRPDALVCVNDLTAISALKACLEEGLRVPKDIAIIGFDDIEAAQYTHPALTSLHQPMEQIITESTQLLIARLEGRETGPPKKRLYEPTLVVRGST